MDPLRTRTGHRRSCSSAQCETGHAGFVRYRRRAHRNILNTETRRSGLFRQGRLGALVDIASEADRDHPDGPIAETADFRHWTSRKIPGQGKSAKAAQTAMYRPGASRSMVDVVNPIFVQDHAKAQGARTRQLRVPHDFGHQRELLRQRTVVC